MRYHRSDPTKPWPLAERLWEARRGFWIGLLEFTILLLCVLAVVEVMGHLLASDRVPLGIPSLAFLMHWWEWVAIIGGGTVLVSWEKELDLVNERTQTFEEIVLCDLKRIVDAVDPPDRWLKKE